MTNKASKAALMKAEAAAEQTMRFIGLAQIYRAEAHEDACDQAIDHFMEEREKLLAEIDQANDILLEIASYATKLQNALNHAGILYRADPNTGDPVIAVNVNRFQEYVRAKIDRS